LIAFNNERDVLSYLLANQIPELSTHILDHVSCDGEELPIYGFTIGSKEPDRFTFCLVGGVHGLEKIGSHVVFSFLNKIVQELSWNTMWEDLLKKIRIVVIPAVNPVGLLKNSRCNGRGVDLMRNAPLDAEVTVTPLVGGHRLSPSLPWYRGENYQNDRSQMETESRALVDFVEKEIFPAPGAIILDVHSGFGFKDRLWYPFAGLKEKFPHEHQIREITKILNRTIPHHIYTIEPQEKIYRTHGDLWDYVFLEHKKYRERLNTDAIILPLTLEIGSWVWLKKNPLQIFQKIGFYNPLKDHRYRRTMRRHFLLLDFLLHMAANPQAWR
jgi:hypothetical protein